ncbi:MAG: methyltransferase [Candidatus Binataceae bacterium]
MAEKEESDPALWYNLDTLVWSCVISQAVHVALELGVPATLKAGPKSTDEIASATRSDPWTLEAILHALAAFEVLDIDQDERFSLTKVGALLLDPSKGLIGEAGAFFETIYRTQTGLMDMAKTGDTAFKSVFGITFYEYLAQNSRAGSFFNEQMIRNGPARYSSISSIYDFSSVSRIVDVGGGQGALILELLRQQPHLTAVLFDSPEVVENSAGRLEQAGLSARCQIVAGNFLESVPAGGDVYFLAAVVSNLNDREARELLKNCRAAMGLKARLLILEPVRDFGKRLPRWAALVELGIMAQRGGRTRTEAQLRNLLQSAGFKLDEIRRYQSGPATVIEAAPIDD